MFLKNLNALNALYMSKKTLNLTGTALRPHLWTSQTTMQCASLGTPSQPTLLWPIRVTATTTPVTPGKPLSRQRSGKLLFHSRLIPPYAQQLISHDQIGTHTHVRRDFLKILFCILSQLNRWSSLAKEWVNNVDKGALHVIYYEDLTRNTRQVLEELANFLGKITWHINLDYAVQ